MTYIELVLSAVGAGAFAALICLLLHQVVHRETFRRYHEVGYAVFIQLGVVFAVMLAFVFNDVWSEYNTAAQSINRECASLHGVAILAERLPADSRDAVLRQLRAYLVAVVDREWPDMERRIESRAAGQQFQSLWSTAATANAGFSGEQVRGQILDLLADTHQSRETRLF